MPRWRDNMDTMVPEYCHSVTTRRNYSEHESVEVGVCDEELHEDMVLNDTISEIINGTEFESILPRNNGQGLAPDIMNFENTLQGNEGM